MIIKDIQLTNFGKFHHKDMPLEPGLNIIYGENEAGKNNHTYIYQRNAFWNRKAKR